MIGQITYSILLQNYDLYLTIAQIVKLIIVNEFKW
jgi:hypothetical protein